MIIDQLDGIFKQKLVYNNEKATTNSGSQAVIRQMAVLASDVITVTG